MMESPTNAFGFTEDELGSCCFCGEVPELDLVHGGGNELAVAGCCLASYEARAHGGYNWVDVYGVGLQASVDLLSAGARVHYCDDFAVRVSHRLTSRLEPSRKVVKAFIAKHHSHNPNPPAADRSRFVCFNGGTLVGVAMLGNPTSRIYAKRNPTHVEVTRVCVAAPWPLRRNACTKLYGEAARWARRHGFTVLITYTRADEEATSCRAAGFQQDEAHSFRGGSFANRSGRAAPDGVRKVRWVRPL